MSSSSLPDLRRLFPDSDAVNRALRKYAEKHRMISWQEADTGQTERNTMRSATNWDAVDALTDDELPCLTLSMT